MIENNSQIKKGQNQTYAVSLLDASSIIIRRKQFQNTDIP